MPSCWQRGTKFLVSAFADYSGLWCAPLWRISIAAFHRSLDSISSNMSKKLFSFEKGKNVPNSCSIIIVYISIHTRVRINFNSTLSFWFEKIYSVASQLCLGWNYALLWPLHHGWINSALSSALWILTSVVRDKNVASALLHQIK